MPPLHEIAHLAHLELRTPVLDEGVAFFTDHVGLIEAAGRGLGWTDGDQLRDTLGAMVTEQIVLDDASLAGRIESFHTHGTPPVVENPVAAR